MATLYVNKLTNVNVIKAEYFGEIIWPIYTSRSCYPLHILIHLIGNISKETESENRNNLGVYLQNLYSLQQY